METCDRILPQFRRIAWEDRKSHYVDFLANFPDNDAGRGIAHLAPAESVSVEKRGRFDEHGDRPLRQPSGNAWSDLRRNCRSRVRNQTDDYPDFVQPLAKPDRAVSARRPRVLHRAPLFS